MRSVALCMVRRIAVRSSSVCRPPSSSAVPTEMMLIGLRRSWETTASASLLNEPDPMPNDPIATVCRLSMAPSVAGI